MIYDMVVCQLGAVEKEVPGDDEKETISTPRAKTDADVKEYLQTLSPGSPFKLLFKTHKRLARQRGLRSLITQAEKLKKRKREEENENDDAAARMDNNKATADDEDSEFDMKPVVISTPEKKAMTLEKLERKRKLEALASRQKRRRYV